jgi:hypothetical protein
LWFPNKIHLVSCGNDFQCIVIETERWLSSQGWTTVKNSKTTNRKSGKKDAKSTNSEAASTEIYRSAYWNITQVES